MLKDARFLNAPLRDALVALLQLHVATCEVDPRLPSIAVMVREGKGTLSKICKSIPVAITIVDFTETVAFS